MATGRAERVKAFRILLEDIDSNITEYRDKTVAEQRARAGWLVNAHNIQIPQSTGSRKGQLYSPSGEELRGLAIKEYHLEKNKARIGQAFKSSGDLFRHGSSIFHQDFLADIEYTSGVQIPLAPLQAEESIAEPQDSVQPIEESVPSVQRMESARPEPSSPEETSAVTLNSDSTISTLTDFSSEKGDSHTESSRGEEDVNDSPDRASQAVTNTDVQFESSLLGDTEIAGPGVHVEAPAGARESDENSNPMTQVTESPMTSLAATNEEGPLTNGQAQMAQTQEAVESATALKKARGRLKLKGSEGKKTANTKAAEVAQEAALEIQNVPAEAEEGIGSNASGLRQADQPESPTAFRAAKRARDDEPTSANKRSKVNTPVAQNQSTFAIDAQKTPVRSTTEVQALTSPEAATTELIHATATTVMPPPIENRPGLTDSHIDASLPWIKGVQEDMTLLSLPHKDFYNWMTAIDLKIQDLAYRIADVRESPNARDGDHIVVEPIPQLRTLYELVFGKDSTGSWKAGAFDWQRENRMDFDLVKAVIGAGVYSLIFRRSVADIVQSAGHTASVWRAPKDLLAMMESTFGSFPRYVDGALQSRRSAIERGPADRFEHVIWQAAQMQIRNPAFQQDVLRPIAKDLAGKLLLTINQQLLQLRVKAQGTFWNESMATLTEIMTDALMVKGSAEASLHEYEFEWVPRGQQYDLSLMEDKFHKAGQDVVSFVTTPVIRRAELDGVTVSVASKAVGCACIRATPYQHKE